MPDVLAIHWDKRRLRVVEVSIGSTVRVVQNFTVEISDLPPVGWLREALRKHGTTARQAVVCLARDEVILRQLELPNAPDDELPALVQFQASTRSTTPLDQLLLDYLPLPRRPGSPQRDVLLATAPRSTVDPIRAILNESGLELIALTISSFALAEFVLRTEASQNQNAAKSRLAVLADGHRLEIVLLGQQEPLVAHLARPPLNEDGRPIVAKAAADISRILVPAQPWLSESPIDRIWLLSDSPEWDGLDQTLQSRWNCSVEHVNSLANLKIRDLELTKFAGSIVQFAPALGLALSRTQPRAPTLDLLHPRQPRPKRDPRKLQLAVGSAAALLLVALVTSFYQLSMASLESRISTASAELSVLNGNSNRGTPDRTAATLIEDWRTHDVNQLQQFGEFYELMQGTKRSYLSEYNFGPTAGEGIAKLHATGNSKERVDWQQLAQRLADAQRYRVKSSRESTQQSRDSEYPNRFELDTDIVQPGKPEPGKSATGAAASPPSATKDK